MCIRCVCMCDVYVCMCVEVCMYVPSYFRFSNSPVSQRKIKKPLENGVWLVFLFTVAVASEGIFISHLHAASEPEDACSRHVYASTLFPITN